VIHFYNGGTIVSKQIAFRRMQVHEGAQSSDLFGPALHRVFHEKNTLLARYKQLSIKRNRYSGDRTRNGNESCEAE
jgi:hypothetical protein